VGTEKWIDKSQPDWYEATFFKEATLLSQQSAVTIFLNSFISCSDTAGTLQTWGVSTSGHLTAAAVLQGKTAIHSFWSVWLSVQYWYYVLSFSFLAENVVKFLWELRVFSIVKTPWTSISPTELCDWMPGGNEYLPRLNSPKSGVFGQEALHLLPPHTHLLAHTDFLSPLVSVSVCRSTGNVSGEHWVICSDCRMKPISHVLGAPLKSPDAPFYYLIPHVHALLWDSCEFHFVGVKPAACEGSERELCCLRISYKCCDGLFALITTLNAETHVIALMSLWCLQIIALSVNMESLRCWRCKHWPVRTNSGAWNSMWEFPHPSPPLVFVWVHTPRAWFRWNVTFNGKFDGSKTTTWNIACVSSKRGGKCQGDVSGRGCFSLDCTL